ncbi:class I SAM-dependent RNA methyltransferase [Mycolicibacter sinensis]|uniref:23S rRNA methyltransferase n=1 Tax=Mycolicibacter sinensis (strain JDM601) TaxID=875328 RepID=A0A1A2XI21_MYCSD|nr:TRAM domain-containing protein [Mycolicibacter sinensis]OBH18825.1 23S rRNA methyltransferase [Mycolicibacter sinensis]OBI24732.1 23S rRNA methyltransferase [Mycolicibacter sinensis]
MIGDELTLVAGAPANGGSCVARQDGRVVFVRYALPGERVRARITAERGSYWHAETVEVLEPADGRVAPLCPIAGVDGAGCCDLAFADPAVARALKGAVVSNQLARLGGHDWEGSAEPVGDDGPTGWRTRVRLDVGADGRAGFHRYHSDELVTDLRCGQLPAGMTTGLAEQSWQPGDHLHVVADDDGVRHVVSTGHNHRPQVREGDYHATQWVGRRRWRIPVTAFWQAHRQAAAHYSALITDWAAPEAGMTAWDLYGGAGIFAAALAQAVGESGRVISVDTSRAATGAARAALADLSQVSVCTDSVRRVLSAASSGADVAVLDPPRTGAGRQVIEALAAAGVPRIVHIGCEAASFARDIGLYRAQGYTVERIRVFDAFPLTHHVECVALLTR